MATGLPWRVLTADDVPAVAALARRCLASDGGLPATAGEAYLASRFAAPGGIAWGIGTDRLIAAGAVRPLHRGGVRQAVITGLIDPARRGRGIGSGLLDRGLGQASRIADAVIVETESLTPAAAALFASRRLRQTFAEDVLRFDLGAVPPALVLPADLAVSTWSAATAGRFYGVYQAAFAGRPGFPGWSAERWVDWTAGDDDFRPQWSLVVGGPAGDVGFITCGAGMIIQVGVRPEHRGRGLGAALVAEALRRMRAAGLAEAVLDVNVDNPAGELYRRVGFAPVGRRPRFEPAG